MTQREFFNTPKDPYPSEVGDEPPPFRGKTADMLSLGALITGLMALFTCLTGGMGVYCLPLIPVGLGLSALLMARDAVNKERTQAWSWMGLGAGVIVLGLTLLCVVCFIAMIVLLEASSQGY